MKIITIVSAKGGVGKSTVCANLSVALHQAGLAALALDLDPQNALRFHIGSNPNATEGVARASLNGQDWRHVWAPGPSGVYLLPYGAVSEPERESFEQQLKNDPQWLRRNLASLGLPPDAVIIIDTPPGPSTYLRQALSVAHLAVVVTLPDAASYATVSQMEELIRNYCSGRPDFHGHYYVLNQVDQTRELSRDVTQILRNALGARLIGRIHADQAVAQALASGTHALAYDPGSQSTQDFVDCARNIAARLTAIRNVSP